MGTKGFKRIDPLYPHAHRKNATVMGFDSIDAVELTVVVVYAYP